MERKSGWSKLFSYFGISAGNKKGPGILAPWKHLYKKQCLCSGPGLCPAKWISGKVRRAASVLYSGETVLGKGNADGDRRAEFVWGEKNGKFYSCFFRGKFKAIGNAGLYLFDGAVQVRNSQCKRVFEKAVSLFSKRGETGRIPAALVPAPKRNGRRQANKNSGCLLWRKETLERLEQKGEMMRNEAVYGRRYGLIQRPWYL